MKTQTPSLIIITWKTQNYGTKQNNVFNVALSLPPSSP